jgi:indole-3-glycerol phosphate synthase
MTTTADLLATIVAATRRIVEVRAARQPMADLALLAERATSGPCPERSRGPGAFRAALSRADRVNIVAECKRRSPSRGVLRADYDPVAIARGYNAAGAAAISVLTEPTFFDGSIDDLANVRNSVDVPLLRKDFVVSEYQLMEARVAGADAVLLIAGALRPAELTRLMARASDLGLDALVEVHNSDELLAALDAGADLVGVNNRNLRTLAVDLDVSEALIARIPKGVTAVSESGIKTPADITRFMALGYRAFLIGERFMMMADPGAELRDLLKTVVSTTKDTKDTKDTKVRP